MTTTDHRLTEFTAAEIRELRQLPEPAELIDHIYAHAADVPPLNPHRFSARASAVILAIAAAGALANVDGDATTNAVNVSALTVALILFLTCMFRFNARADAGDR